MKKSLKLHDSFFLFSFLPYCLLIYHYANEILADDGFDLYRYLKDSETLVYEPLSFLVISILRYFSSSDFIQLSFLVLLAACFYLKVVRSSQFNGSLKIYFILALSPFVFLINFRYGLGIVFIMFLPKRFSMIALPFFHWFFSLILIRNINKWAYLFLIILIASSYEFLNDKLSFYLTVDDYQFGYGLFFINFVNLLIYRNIFDSKTGPGGRVILFYLIIFSVVSTWLGFPVIASRLANFFTVIFFILTYKQYCFFRSTLISNILLITSLTYSLYIFSSMTSGDF